MRPILTYQLTASGGTLDNYNDSMYPDILISSAGAITLTSSFSITPSVDTDYARFRVIWEAEATLSTFSITVCGETVSQDQVNQPGIFECIYDGSAWIVFYFPDATKLPQNAPGADSITVPVGGTITLEPGVDKVNQRLVGGPTTLTSNLTVTASTIGVRAGAEFNVYVDAGTTIGANDMTIFGRKLSAAQALTGGVEVRAYYDGSAWRGVLTSKPISASELSSQVALSVVANATNASASPTPVQFTSDGQVLMRSGSSLAPALLSAANFGASTFALNYAVLNVSSGDILTGFGTPVSIVAGVVGKAHIPVFVVWETTFNTTPYATNTNAVIRSTGATSPAIQQNGLLAFTTSGYALTQALQTGSYTEQVIKGVDLEFAVLTGNPTAGDGTLKIHLFYITI